MLFFLLCAFDQNFPRPSNFLLKHSRNKNHSFWSDFDLGGEKVLMVLSDVEIIYHNLNRFASKFW
ncbi:MAG: hypothetical protein C0401_05630 [Anaerolinea sp.]|nr:hypothetical protein [Anaerolinea sp.]